MMQKQFFFFLSLSLAFTYAQQVCSWENPNNGEKYNQIEMIKKPIENPYIIRDSTGDLYWFNICDIVSCEECDCTKNASVCQLAINGLYYDCGSVQSWTFSESKTQGIPGISMYYKDGTVGTCTEPRNTTINLVCNPDIPDSEQGKVTKVIETNNSCTYEFVLESPFACPESGSPINNNNNSNPVGWIVAGFLFGLLFCYCLIGSVYNWRVKGKSGKEIIPQSNIWFNLPSLIKDKLCSGGRSSYSSLE